MFLVPAHSFAAITSVITVDRLGNGLRTAPRDALIASASPPSGLGRVFGVHRALDTLGALVGPLLAFLILFIVPNDYRSVFIASSAFAVVGVAILLLIVPDLRPRRRAQSKVPGRAKPGRVSLRLLRDRRGSRLLIAAGLLVC